MDKNRIDFRCKQIENRAFEDEKTGIHLFTLKHTLEQMLIKVGKIQKAI